MWGNERTSAARLTVGVLGPLELTADGRPITVTSGRLRTLLAVLAMSAGKTVSVDRLATALWGDKPPGNARRGVQTYLTRLRSALGSVVITTEPTGYVLHTEPDQVDALRFIRLLSAAAAASVSTEPSAERTLLAEALALWRGTPFDGVRSAWLEQAEAPRLVERYLAAVERRIDLDLADGRHGELVAELGELTAQHPLRESLWVRLLVVLDRCGRPAEALKRYERIRIRLANELGVDPGPELQRVHAELLNGKTAQRAGSTDPAVAIGPVVPRQLPADLDGFTGRAMALKALDDLLGERTERAGRVGPVVISAIAGTAGVGKTALAVHWAHQVADQFPDGQLYVNLRGFDPSGSVMAPGEAVRGFLDALGVSPQRVPSDLNAQAGLYRSLLAGKRVLVVLDNARDAGQVRPLLPGSPGCLVVVTSRNQLISLIATEAARPLLLDLLPVDEARELLVRRLGADRIAAESRAADEVVNRCARLPLALAIVAARAATNPGLTLDTLAAQVRDARTSLAALTAGDAVTDVRAVFSWSYQALSADAARLFRLLGVHPGPDISVSAAASLAGLPVDQVRPLLVHLSHAHLVIEHVPGRYTFHDLLRSYATELSHAHDTDMERRAATHRLLDHYLHTASTAALLLDPHRDPINVAAPQPGVTLEDLGEHGPVMAWFTTEHTVLLAIIEQAVATGFDDHAWQIAWTLNGFLLRRGLWHDLAATERTAVEAARRAGDRAAQAGASRGMASACLVLGQFDDAEVLLRQALDLYGELGDDTGRAHSHRVLGTMFDAQGRHAEGLSHAQEALELCRSTGHRFGQASALNQIGWHLAHLGGHERALAVCRQALDLHREIGDRRGEASTWDSLGYAHYQLGQHDQAVTCYQHALRLLNDLGDRYHEAGTLNRMGDAHQAAADPEAARTAWFQALGILEELDHLDADEVRSKLRGRAEWGA